MTWSDWFWDLYWVCAIGYVVSRLFDKDLRRSIPIVLADKVMVKSVVLGYIVAFVMGVVEYLLWPVFTVIVLVLLRKHNREKKETENG